MGPGSAEPRYTRHRVRDTRFFTLARGYVDQFGAIEHPPRLVAAICDGKYPAGSSIAATSQGVRSIALF
jgi:hypothetical protein